MGGGQASGWCGGEFDRTRCATPCTRARYMRARALKHSQVIHLANGKPWSRSSSSSVCRLPVDSVCIPPCENRVEAEETDHRIC